MNIKEWVNGVLKEIYEQTKKDPVGSKISELLTFQVESLYNQLIEHFSKHYQKKVENAYYKGFNEGLSSKEEEEKGPYYIEGLDKD